MDSGDGWFPPPGVNLNYRASLGVVPVLSRYVSRRLCTVCQGYRIGCGDWDGHLDEDGRLITIFCLQHRGTLPSFSLQPASLVTRLILPACDRQLKPSFRKQYYVDGLSSADVARVLRSDVQGWLEAFRDDCWHVESGGGWLLMHQGRRIPDGELGRVLEGVAMLADLLGVPRYDA